MRGMVEAASYNIASWYVAVSLFLSFSSSLARLILAPSLPPSSLHTSYPLPLPPFLPRHHPPSPARFTPFIRSTRFAGHPSPPPPSSNSLSSVQSSTSKSL